MDDLVKNLKQQLEDLDINLFIVEDRIVITFTIDSKDVELICKLPDAFPYVFPRIFVSDKTKKQIGLIPHINSNLSLCLFDSEKVVPNFTAPKKLIEETIRQAYKVIKEGIQGNNTFDFLDEFNAYWTKDSKFPFYSDVIFGSDLLYLKFCIGDYGCYISKNNEDSVRIAVSRGEVADKLGLKDCIYVPLREPCYEDKIDTQGDFWSIIKNKSDYRKEYSDFISKRTASKTLVLFSQPKESEFIVSGFLHNKISAVDGFREGRAPLEISLAGNEGLKEIQHIALTDISQKRLFFRGGSGCAVSDKTFGIVGCGSLGSNLTETLMNCGCSKFLLCDNQILTEENIARHACGFSDVKRPKTEALKNKITRHNPNAEINVCNEDIHSVLSKNPDFLNENDCLILTVANTPIEYRTVELFRKGVLKGPVVIMWVEPYAMAGHALVLNKPQDIYSELFAKDFTFGKSLILNGEKYYKREAGCQSTFMPYSGLDVKSFSISFSKFFTSNNCESNKNYHYMWTGNLSSAKDYGIELTEKSAELEEYKSYIERID